jgi:hypothetical protein
MAGSGALAVYQALLRNGYSTTQAIGLMANAQFESRFDPEAIGDGGTSFGVFQFHNGGAVTNGSGFVTGNPTADLNKQVAYLTTVAGPRSAAAAGSTPQQVAGNWSRLFERCAGCQPGGSEYNQRVGFASTVAGWVSSGRWTTSSGTPPATGGGGATPGAGAGGTGGGTSTVSTPPASSGTTSGSTCLASFPVIGCLIQKTFARQVLGGLVIAGAFVIVLVGADLLFKSAGLGGSGGGMGKAARTTGEMLALFPPAEGAGVALTAAGGAANRTAAHRARGRAAATGERRASTGERRASTGERRAATGAKNARTAQSRAATYQHRAATERSRRRAESSARQYRAQTERSQRRSESRARQYNAQTARQRENRLAKRP